MNLSPAARPEDMNGPWQKRQVLAGKSIRASENVDKKDFSARMVQLLFTGWKRLHPRAVLQPHSKVIYFPVVELWAPGWFL